MSSNNNNNNGPTDVLIPACPPDTVSSLHWSPNDQFLLATSWSKDVCIWQIDSQNGKAEPKATKSDKAPLLCSAWNSDNSSVFVAGCSTQASQWNLGSGTMTTVAAHKSPIKEIFYVGDTNLLVTAGWDKMINYWDMRSSNTTAAITVSLPERIYCMDVKYPALVVGTADRPPKSSIYIYDISSPQAMQRPYRDVVSTLKYQQRTLSIFPDRAGFAVGSIEGRCAIIHMSEKDKGKDFAFKCHREEKTNEIYAVNSISFHQPYGTFATAGSDGRFAFWDKDAKQRLKQKNDRMSNAVVSGDFNAQGNIYAYAVGYDWSKGVEYASKGKEPNGILLHAVQDADIRRKDMGTGNNNNNNNFYGGNR